MVFSPALPSWTTFRVPFGNCGFSRSTVLNGRTSVTISKRGCSTTRVLRPWSGVTCSTGLPTSTIWSTGALETKLSRVKRLVSWPFSMVTSTSVVFSPFLPSWTTFRVPLGNCGFSRSTVLNGRASVTTSKRGCSTTGILTPSSGVVLWTGGVVSAAFFTSWIRYSLVVWPSSVTTRTRLGSSSLSDWTTVTVALFVAVASILGLVPWYSRR